MKSLLLLLIAGAASAQGLPDPTRPPTQLLHPVAAGAATAGPQLQSILIGRGAGGRRIAVIDGNTVRVGDRVGSARVLAINAADVQLARGATREVLKLPALDAAPARPERGTP